MRVAGRRRDLVEVLARGLGVVIPARDRAEQCAIPHDEQVLSEAIVQLGCDALPLRLLGGDQLLAKACWCAASRRMRVMWRRYANAARSDHCQRAAVPRNVQVCQ